MVALSLYYKYNSVWERKKLMLSNIVIYSLLAGLATIAGMFLVLNNENWARRNTIYLISFSAGVLLSVAFTHLIPEALKLNSNGLLWLLFGFVFFYILEHLIIIHSCQEDDACTVHPIDKIALLGMGFHSLLDGVIIGIGFEISNTLGLLTTLAVLLHKLPDGISMVSVLLHSDYTKKKARDYSLLVASMTPIGAILSYLFLKNISTGILGIFLAVAAGSFLYIASADLIPEIHKKSKILNIVLLIVGIIMPFLIERLFK